MGYTEDQFKNDLEVHYGIISNRTLSREDLNALLQKYLLKIIKGALGGIMSSDEAMDFVKDRKNFLKNIQESGTLWNDDAIKNFQTRNKRNFLEGGIQNTMQWSLMYIKLGGKDGTGMDIDTFEDLYFKKYKWLE